MKAEPYLFEEMAVHIIPLDPMIRTLNDTCILQVK